MDIENLEIKELEITGIEVMDLHDAMALPETGASNYNIPSCGSCSCCCASNGGG